MTGLAMMLKSFGINIKPEEEAISTSYVFNSGNTTEATIESGMDWKSTAAITSVTITPASAANFIAGTTAILYGIN